MKPTIDKRYVDLIRSIYHNGTLFAGRNGYTRALMDTFPQLTWNLRNECFPIIALRKQNIDHYINEFLWELNGDSDINNLDSIYAPVDSRFLWNSWADTDGHVAYSYGACWRSNGFYGIDQIELILQELKNNMYSRRLTLVTQNVLHNYDMINDEFDVPQVSPCHPCIQFSSDGVFLNAHVFSRSQDIVVGLPGDMIRYSLLTMVLAQLSGLIAKNICFSFTNLHYYMEHETDLLELLMERQDAFYVKNAPGMTIEARGQKTVEDFIYSDFTLTDYEPNKFKSFKLIV